MQTRLMVILVSILAARAASAEPSDTTPRLDLHVGAGVPVGGTGLGLRVGPVEVLVEGEAMAGPFVLAASASAHVNVDLVRRPRTGLYVGAFGCLLFVVAGSDEVADETYRGGGAVAGFRFHGRSSRLSHAVEAGAVYARCADARCMDGGAFVSFDLAYRMSFHLL